MNKWMIEQIIMASLLLVMTVEDIKKQVLNLRWMLLMSLIGIGMNLIMNNWTLQELIMGSLIGIILMIVSRFSHAIGTGDGMLFLAVGLISGWQDCFYILVGSSFLCLPVGLFLRFIRHKQKNDMIPFTPFVLASWFCQILI